MICSLIYSLITVLFVLDNDQLTRETFPIKRLNEWVSFLHRTPAKVGEMRWDFAPSDKSWTFFNSPQGSLNVSKSDANTTETIKNGDYSASVVLSEGGVPRLEKIWKDDHPAPISNGFYHTSTLAPRWPIPDLIQQNEILLSNVETFGSKTRYKFECIGKLSENFDGILLEFDDLYSIPIFSQVRIKATKRKIILQQFRYSDFIEVNGEWVPTKFTSSVSDENGGNSRPSSVEISYDPTVRFERERFRLSHYSIPEPEMAKIEAESKIYFWLAGFFLAVVFLIASASYFRTRRDQG